MGFLTTWGMREIYRRTYRENTGIAALCALVLGVSMLGALVQAFLCLAFHDVFDLEEEKIFKNAVVFGVIYFRGALCLAWSFLYFGIRLWQEKTSRELRLALIESEERGAKLQMLRAQMNPHFLFNALNTIRAGIGEKAQELIPVIDGFAGYLRYSLAHRKDDLVVMHEEFETMNDYLTVEKARFGDDLKLDCLIESAARDVTVPGVLLQPLVENAIKYGRMTSPLPLCIRVRVTTESDSLCIEVANTGKWIQPSSGEQIGGVGLGNLRQRLELLYPDAHTFKTVTESELVIVAIRIPRKDRYERNSPGHHRR